MAKNNNLVLLGYEDDSITDKHKGLVDYTVNKIGGEPDFPHPLTTQISCQLCRTPSRLIVQIYAPLDTCKDQRTLYLFACINPSCWNKSESWTCLRMQRENLVSEIKQENNTQKMNSTDWCSEADDWGDDNNVNLDEENCNVVSKSEDEESSSFDESVKLGIRNLSIDEKNANSGAQGGAVATLHPLTATAEIEGNEEGVNILVDTPINPERNLEALLHGNFTDITRISPNVSFVASFMSVYPEEEITTSSPFFDSHVNELLNDYQRRSGDALSVQMEECDQGYEKSRPLHGDKMFHYFITKIKSSPEQVLRYHREGSPLLLYSLREKLKHCRYCQSELVFEFQLVPTLISKLRLECDPNCTNRMDFGTVLVFTCKNSCWDRRTEVREEVVVVQKEIL